MEWGESPGCEGRCLSTKRNRPPRGRTGITHHVYAVQVAGHFPTLVVAVATRIGVGSKSTAAATPASFCQCSSKVFYFFLKADVVLLELANGDRRRWEGADLLRRVPQSSLELGHRLFQLKGKRKEELASRVHNAASSLSSCSPGRCRPCASLDVWPEL